MGLIPFVPLLIVMWGNQAAWNDQSSAVAANQPKIVEPAYAHHNLLDYSRQTLTDDPTEKAIDYRLRSRSCSLIDETARLPRYECSMPVVGRVT